MLTLKTLTPEQIDAMPAGREMDALVSEQLMGIKVGWAKEVGSVLILFEPHPFVVGTGTEIPYYSTDIAAAWKLVVGNFTLDYPKFYGKWRCCFYLKSESSGSRFNFIGIADTAQLAICRAALKKVIL